jgi:hypothetical protein
LTEFDLQETPAVPPFDPGGDERLGYFVAGTLLVLVGWVGGVALNLALHSMAGPGGLPIGPVRIDSTLGLFAQLTLGIGAFTGLIGVGILALGWRSRKGPLVLPGYPY